MCNPSSFGRVIAKVQLGAIVRPFRQWWASEEGVTPPYVDCRKAKLENHSGHFTWSHGNWSGQRKVSHVDVLPLNWASENWNNRRPCSPLTQEGDAVASATPSRTSSSATHDGPSACTPSWSATSGSIPACASARSRAIGIPRRGFRSGPTTNRRWNSGTSLDTEAGCRRSRTPWPWMRRGRDLKTLIVSRLWGAICTHRCNLNHLQGSQRLTKHR